MDADVFRVRVTCNQDSMHIIFLEGQWMKGAGLALACASSSISSKSIWIWCRFYFLPTLSTAAVCLSSKTQTQDGIFIYFSIKHLQTCCATPCTSTFAGWSFFVIDLITFVLHEQPVPQRLNLFFPGSRHLDTSQQNLFVPKPLHNPPPTVEFIGEMNGFLSLSSFSELVCVSPAADISFLFRLCARWFSDQKMHYVSKPVVHGWITLGARGFHESTKVPHRGSSYTHVLYSDNPLQGNWMLGWVECNGEFSGGFFNVCIFAQRPAQPSRAAVWVSGEQAGRFKV